MDGKTPALVLQTCPLCEGQRHLDTDASGPYLCPHCAGRGWVETEASTLRLVQKIATATSFQELRGMLLEASGIARREARILRPGDGVCPMLADVMEHEAVTMWSMARVIGRLLLGRQGKPPAKQIRKPA